MLAFAGCGTSAQATKLRSDAIGILGSVAVNALSSVVQAQVSGGNADLAHSAAQAAWSAVSASNLEALINDATANKMPSVAATAASVASKAIANNGVSKADALNAVAAVISATAQK